MKSLTIWFVPQNPHEKQRQYYLLKKVIIRKVNFIHFDIEELANNQSKKVQLKKTTTLL